MKNPICNLVHSITLSRKKNVFMYIILWQKGGQISRGKKNKGRGGRKGKGRVGKGEGGGGGKRGGKIGGGGEGGDQTPSPPPSFPCPSPLPLPLPTPFGQGGRGRGQRGGGGPRATFFPAQRGKMSKTMVKYKKCGLPDKTYKNRQRSVGWFPAKIVGVKTDTLDGGNLHPQRCKNHSEWSLRRNTLVFYPQHLSIEKIINVF
jgi:hypothetical protein